MSDDDPLREAADPLTPPERLWALWQSGGSAPRSRALEQALMSNPAAPLDLLRWWLTCGYERSWFNAGIPLLMLTQPFPELRNYAQTVLARHGPAADARLPLATLVARWAQVAQRAARSADEERALTLAHRLAELFDLPWPGRLTAVRTRAGWHESDRAR